MSKAFMFELDEKVEIVESGESGIVIGRADYAHAEDSYLVRYKAGDGRCVENWWTQSAIAPAI